jgi:type VI secretion system protein ImpA
VDDTLLQPIAVDAPCGESLEDKEPLLKLDSFRIFGESTSPDERPDPRDPDKRLPPPDWAEIKKLSLDGLRKSKDLRVLAYLGTAALRTDGLPVFAETLSAASHWLETYWAETYPRIDEDAIARRSALNCLADPMAVIDALRKTTLIASRQHGRFALRQIDLAAGIIAPSDGETRPSEAQINAAFAEMPTDHLHALRQSIAVALAAVKAITEKMSETAGPDAAPEVNPLIQVLGRIAQVLDAQLEPRLGTADGESGATGAVRGATARGAIGSRQDAIRALDAVAEFFRRNEPSSPIPMFCDRAKRLVSKDFLEVLADVAPDAVTQARLAGGLKDGD